MQSVTFLMIEHGDIIDYDIVDISNSLYEKLASHGFKNALQAECQTLTNVADDSDVCTRTSVGRLTRDRRGLLKRVVNETTARESRAIQRDGGELTYLLSSDLYSHVTLDAI